MAKASIEHKNNKMRGEAYEIVSIMAILCVQALERRHTRHAKNPNTVIEIFKDKEYLRGLKEAYAHDKDLKVLAKHFSIFLRVIEKVARGG